MAEDKHSDPENKNRYFDLSSLTQSALFSKIRKAQLDYAAGEHIFKQGAFAPYVIYVLDGLVKVFLQTGKEKQINLRISQGGDFLAFSSVFGDPVYNYSALALKDTSICMIDKEGMKQIMLEDNDFAMQVTSKNCLDQNILFEIIRNLSHKQMPGKLASALLYLSSDQLKEEQVFELLSRRDIADFAGISLESAVKLLKEFERDHLLRLEGKNIVITDTEGLTRVSRKG